MTVTSMVSVTKCEEDGVNGPSPTPGKLSSTN